MKFEFFTIFKKLISSCLKMFSCLNAAFDVIWTSAIRKGGFYHVRMSLG